MYQTIHEPIAVAGVFSHGTFVPKKCVWNGRVFLFSQITMVANFTDGGRPQRQYSVVSEGNVYRLLYWRDSEDWFLEEVWCEG